LGREIALDYNQPGFWLAILQIIWINILLSGDNAVVIAMACRSLSDNSRKWGMILGAAVAVVLRIIFTIIVTTLMGIPFLKLAGALALLYIAVDLIKPKDEDGSNVAAHENLWRAIMTIAVADVVMSLDNVIAIAAVAKGSWLLLSIGLVISIPMIIAGAALIMMVLDRFPILVWAGAALLGWIAGELMLSDPAVTGYLGEAVAHKYEMAAAAIGAIIVVAIGYLLSRRAAAASAGGHAGH
jgi:YjbE family integral membrane protein